MMLEGPVDLGTVDGRVARAQASLERELARLATKEGREEARGRDPFGAFRDVAGQTTFKALSALEPGPVHAPHRDALLRWVHELLQARVAWDLVLDEADAIHALDPALRPELAEHETATPKTFDEAWRALVEAPHPVAADLALRRVSELAPRVVGARNELRARRFEAARRLGLDHPWSLATTEAATRLPELARTVLDATEPLALELHKDLRRRSGDLSGPALAIHDAFARDAQEGWPARLTARWLEDTFRALAPRPPRLACVPSALGGASFLRAAHAWGLSLRLGGVARSLPFALARDVYPVEAHLVGFSLAVAVSDRVFARRKLGLMARSADTHARALARTLFVALRSLAAEVLAGMPDRARADELEELSSRLFGAPLPADACAAWSYGGLTGRRCIDAPARLLAAVRTHGFVRSMVDRFDEDWFDNPRAGMRLSSMAAGPVWSGEVVEADSVRVLARAFEEALG